tara:strand:- start:4292 stop:4834 length:543 start_codon:yes stop_codon:yes gene_type:complete
MIRTKNIAVYEKYFKYLIVFIVSIFTILNFLSQRSFERDIANNDIKLNNCEYFIFSKNLDTQKNEIKFDLNKEDIYVFPEIANLICLGKIGDLNYSNDRILGNVYTNTKFINIILFLFNSFILTFNFLVKDFKDSTYFLSYIFFNLGILYNFYNSLNVISLNFIFVPLIIYFFTKTENIE